MAHGTMTPDNCNQLHVLLIDPHDDTRAVFADALADCGYCVDTAPTAADALAILRLARPHAIVTETVLPDLPPHAILAAARREPPIPIIALTAHTGPDDLTTTYSAGYSAVLIKPTNIPELDRTIRRYTAPAA